MCRARGLSPGAAYFLRSKTASERTQRISYIIVTGANLVRQLSVRDSTNSPGRIRILGEERGEPERLPSARA